MIEIVFALHLIASSFGESGSLETTTINTELQFRTETGCYIAGQVLIHEMLREGEFDHFNHLISIRQTCIPDVRIDRMGLPTPEFREIPED